MLGKHADRVSLDDDAEAWALSTLPVQAEGHRHSVELILNFGKSSVHPHSWQRLEVRHRGCLGGHLLLHTRMVRLAVWHRSAGLVEQPTQLSENLRAWRGVIMVANARLRLAPSVLGLDLRQPQCLDLQHRTTRNARGNRALIRPAGAPKATPALLHSETNVTLSQPCDIHVAP